MPSSVTSTSKGKPSHLTTLIFDIGDVLFTWSAETKTNIPASVIKKLVTSPTWHEYERGRITQAECYSSAASQFSLDAKDIADAFDQARASLRPNSQLIDFIKDMKRRHHLKVYAMSNISQEDYKVLREKDVEWDIFDYVYTSGAAGERKPHLPFYHSVLSHADIDPPRTLFIDDKLVNVRAAQALGMQSVVFESTGQIMESLVAAFCQPIDRAQNFLRENAGSHDSFTDTGVKILDNFAQFLIYELTGDRPLINFVDSPRLFNFFRGKGELTTEAFPCDLDTTSIAWTTVKDPNDPVVQSVMDEMLEYRNADGVMQVYFDHSRQRTDPVAALNVLSLFYSHGRGYELNRTLEWVTAVLEHRTYLKGSRYYESAEAFLYFFARLVCLGAGALDHLSRPLRKRLIERIGLPGDSLGLAMRVIACALLEVPNEVDINRLLKRQELDGSWADGQLYKYGSSGILIGNKGLTTAFAVKAIEAFDSVKKIKPMSKSINSSPVIPAPPLASL